MISDEERAAQRHAAAVKTQREYWRKRKAVQRSNAASAPTKKRTQVYCHVLTTAVTRDMDGDLYAIADACGVTASAVIRAAIMALIADHKDGRADDVRYWIDKASARK